MSLSRKNFVASVAAVSAAVLSAPTSASEMDPTERAPVHFHILKSTEYDYAGLMRTLDTTAKNKQVFQASPAAIVAPGVASIYIHMQNSMNAFQFSYPQSDPLTTIGVLMAPAMVFALNDAMWKKYDLGASFGLSPTNTYYRAGSNLSLSANPDDPNSIYQDWSAEAVLKRGGKFFVCHNATTAVAMVTATKRGSSPAAVLADFEKNLLPGFAFVPAGVATVQQAVQKGWHLFQV